MAISLVTMDAKIVFLVASAKTRKAVLLALEVETSSGRRIATRVQIETHELLEL